MKTEIRFWPYRTSRPSGQQLWRLEGTGPDDLLVIDFIKLLLVNGNKNRADNHIGFEVRKGQTYFCIHFSDNAMIWTSSRTLWEDSGSKEDWEVID